MNSFFTQIQEVIKGLSLVRKVSMGLTLGIAISLISYLVHETNKVSMEPLFTNLNSDDMGSVLTHLDKQGVSYRVDQEHRTVMVPSSQVLDLRLKLASEGFPRFGGIGFEIFDKTGFGMSEFEQRVNYQRALEGELARTISNIKEVEAARVHLVLPEKSLFADSHQSATASVILTLGNSQVLDRSKVNAITHLVATAVESLDADQVTVIDAQGHLLSSPAQDDGSSIAGGVLDQKLQVEKSYEKRVVELLNPVVGIGKVVARISVSMDFTRMESTDEIIDPTRTAILNESRTTSKKKESSAGSGGAAGTASNDAGGGSGGASSGNSGSADEGSEQISYQVSKTVRKQYSPVGAIKSLSVAILVDGNYTPDKTGKIVYSPRTQEELTKIEGLVKNAMGFDDKRGDQIKIENMPFQLPEVMTAESAAWYEKKTSNSFLVSIISNAILVLIGILVLLFVLRPLMKSYTQVRGGSQALGAGNPQALLEAGNGFRADVGQLIKSDPAAAAQAIRQWLK